MLYPFGLRPLAAGKAVHARVPECFLGTQGARGSTAPGSRSRGLTGSPVVSNLAVELSGRT